MHIARTVLEMRQHLAAARAGGKRIGIVPTMGSLHEGHLSLVRASLALCDVTVVTIFVNPAQFGPNMDFDKYPRNFERDRQMLAEAGVQHIFAPTTEEIYPPGFVTWTEVEHLSKLLDGASRPGYFRGICTVVLKLFNIVQPTAAFFGQKDYQQAVVLRRLVRDLNLDIGFHIMPIIREADGLAMSSRNTLLSPKARAIAPVLYRSLEEARKSFEAGERKRDALLQTVRRTLEKEPEIAVDYIEIVDAEEIQRLTSIDRPACLALAVNLQGTRLIDNILLG